MAERHMEPDSRSRVPCFQGFEQLEVSSSSVQSDHRSDGHAGSGSVCRQNQFSAPCVCELEARSSSNSYRCIHDQMARQGLVVHVPSILHGREMLSENSGRKSNSYSDDLYMASADILSTVATNVLLPQMSILLQGPRGDHPLISMGSLTLAAWKVSGETSVVKDYQDQLKRCFRENWHRERSQLMQAPGTTGVAGVTCGAWIRFQPCGGYNQLVS